MVWIPVFTAMLIMNVLLMFDDGKIQWPMVFGAMLNVFCITINLMKLYNGATL